MDRMNPIFYGLCVIVYFAILSYSRKKDSPKLLKYVSRLFVLLMFSVAILSLGAFSLFIPEVGLFKRIIAGIFALAILAYLINILKDYRQT